MPTARVNGRLVAVVKLRRSGLEPPSADDYVRCGWPEVMVAGGESRVSSWSEMDARVSAPVTGLREETGTWAC